MCVVYFRYQETDSWTGNNCPSNKRINQGTNTTSIPTSKNIISDCFKFQKSSFKMPCMQGIENIAVDEMRARESHGKDVNIALKNNIEAIILKWSYQVIFSADSKTLSEIIIPRLMKCSVKTLLKSWPLEQIQVQWLKLSSGGTNAGTWSHCLSKWGLTQPRIWLPSFSPQTVPTIPASRTWCLKWWQLCKKLWTSLCIWNHLLNSLRWAGQWSLIKCRSHIHTAATVFGRCFNVNSTFTARSGWLWPRQFWSIYLLRILNQQIEKFLNLGL